MNFAAEPVRLGATAARASYLRRCGQTVPRWGYQL